MAIIPISITDLTTTQLENLIEALGEPRYRAKQIKNWVYQRLAPSFEQMTDLPQAFRQRLACKAGCIA
jgi:23S rRNA (adenine2503-C2)-methyltransferase